MIVGLTNFVFISWSSTPYLELIRWALDTIERGMWLLSGLASGRWDHDCLTQICFWAKVQVEVWELWLIVFWGAYRTVICTRRYGPLATANKSSQGVVLLLVCALIWLNIFHFVTMRERRNRVSPPTAQLQHLMNQIFLSVFMRKDYQMRPVKHAKLICLHSVTNHSLLEEVELLSVQSSFQLDAG